MPIFEWVCPHGHVTEKMVPLSERQEIVACEHENCVCMAVFVVSATPTTFRANDRRAFKREGR